MAKVTDEYNLVMFRILEELCSFKVQKARLKVNNFFFMRNSYLPVYHPIRTKQTQMYKLKTRKPVQ